MAGALSMVALSVQSSVEGDVLKRTRMARRLPVLLRRGSGNIRNVRFENPITRGAGSTGVRRRSIATRSADEPCDDGCPCTFIRRRVGTQATNEKPQME